MMCIKAVVKIGRSDLMLENVEIINTQNMIDIIGKIPVRSQEEIDEYIEQFDIIETIED